MRTLTVTFPDYMDLVSKSSHRDNCKTQPIKKQHRNILQIVVVEERFMDIVGGGFNILVFYRGTLVLTGVNSW